MTAFAPHPTAPRQKMATVHCCGSKSRPVGSLRIAMRRYFRHLRYRTMTALEFIEFAASPAESVALGQRLAQLGF